MTSGRARIGGVRNHKRKLDAALLDETFGAQRASLMSARGSRALRTKTSAHAAADDRPPVGLPLSSGEGG